MLNILTLGPASTVTVTKLEQPPDKLYSITAVPCATPVQEPDDGSTVAIAVLLLLNVPPPVAG